MGWILKILILCLCGSGLFICRSAFTKQHGYKPNSLIRGTLTPTHSYPNTPGTPTLAHPHTFRIKLNFLNFHLFLNNWHGMMFIITEDEWDIRGYRRNPSTTVSYIYCDITMLIKLEIKNYLFSTPLTPTHVSQGISPFRTWMNYLNWTRISAEKAESKCEMMLLTLMSATLHKFMYILIVWLATWLYVLCYDSSSLTYLKFTLSLHSSVM